MLTIEIKGRKHKIPGSLDECTTGQVLAYTTLFIAAENKLVKHEDGKAVVANRELYNASLNALLCKLLGINKKLFFKIPKQERERLLFEENLCDFFFTDFLSLNKITKIRKGFTNYYGPVRMFHQLTFGEFRFAYEQYTLAEQDSSCLDWLMAILYRRAKKGYRPGNVDDTGDMREPFNHNSVESRIKVVKYLPLPVKLAVYLWFSHCLVLLKENYPLVFERQEMERRDSNGDFLDVALSLSGKSENLQTILGENVYMSFKRMSRLIQIANEIISANETK